MSVYPDLDALDQLADHIKLRRSNEVLDTAIAHGELTVASTVSGVLDLVEFLRRFIDLFQAKFRFVFKIIIKHIY